MLLKAELCGLPELKLYLEQLESVQMSLRIMIKVQ